MWQFHVVITEHQTTGSFLTYAGVVDQSEFVYSCWNLNILDNVCQYRRFSSTWFPEFNRIIRWHLPADRSKVNPHSSNLTDGCFNLGLMRYLVMSQSMAIACLGSITRTAQSKKNADVEVLIEFLTSHLKQKTVKFRVGLLYYLWLTWSASCSDLAHLHFSPDLISFIFWMVFWVSG